MTKAIKEILRRHIDKNSKSYACMFACDDKRHLHLLAKIAHLTRNPETLSFINSQPGKAHLLNYIKEWETNLSLSQLAGK